MCLIVFTVDLFSCVNFSWIQLTLKIHYHQKFSDLRYAEVVTIYANLLLQVSGILNQACASLNPISRDCFVCNVYVCALSTFSN